MKTLCFLVLGLLACGDKDESYDAILALEGDVAAGEAVYTSSCASCHGADGEGVSGPAINDHVFEHGDDHILETVFSGDGTMPAFDLSDQEAADLLAYLHDAFE